MAVSYKRPKGTQDALPNEINKWHTVEALAAETAECFGFREIRFPTFEDTALFNRSVGDTSDVVTKEMYSVTAKSPANGKDPDFTLRPEGTAGAARAVIENGLLNEAFPQKIYYIISCFRHEKPQAGRLREFHQFGAEMYGSALPSADADMIAMAKTLLDRLGLNDIELFINSIGCPKCRADYHKALKDYFTGRRDELCDTCKERLEKNPMRILDCKSSVCSEIAKGAPVIPDFLCDECREHFEQLQKLLSAMNIKYTVNPKIVRGLDYYTRTVFEFVSNAIGAQGTVCGGGRYDGMIELMGGKATPALGFAMGLERIIMLMDKQQCAYKDAKQCTVYIASMDEKSLEKAAELTKLLRTEGYWAEYDLVGRSLNAQFKYADKIGAKFSMAIGSDELETGKAILKNMSSGEKSEIALDVNFTERFSDIVVSDMFENVLADNK